MDELLPRDLLRYSTMVSGEEIDKQIFNAAAYQFGSTPSVRKTDEAFSNWRNPINVMNGDTVEFTWTWHDPENNKKHVAPGKVLFHATGTGQVYTSQLSNNVT